MPLNELEIFHHPYFRFGGWSHPLFKLFVSLPAFFVGLYLLMEFSFYIQLSSIALFGLSFVSLVMLKKQSKVAEFLLLLEDGIYGKTYSGQEIFLKWPEIEKINENFDLWFGVNLVAIEGKEEKLFISRHIKKFPKLMKLLHKSRAPNPHASVNGE